MTREKLIQTPEYWRTLYENECERLGIEPILKFVKPINEEELDKLANEYVRTQFTEENSFAAYCRRDFKSGFRKAKQQC